MGGLGLVVSGVNAEAIRRAVARIKLFLDSVGAKYRYHDSGKSDSAYFHVREPAAVAEDPWNPDVVDARISDHTLPAVYDPPDLDVSVPRPRPKAVSPDFAVKLLKDFLRGRVSIEGGEVVAVDSSLGLSMPSRVAGCLRRIQSAARGGGVALAHLADLIGATQADIHYLHFYAGGGGSWDRIHDVCADYYLRLAEDYDDVIELCLQIGVDIVHPNDAAGAAGFENSRGSLGHLFEYESAMEILQDRLHNLVDVAAEVAGGYQGSDVDSVAVRNYLEGFIEEWSKEADFKLRGRLDGERDFGGAYRDRVPGEPFGGEPEGELITGDADEPGPFGDVYSGVTSLRSGGRRGNLPFSSFVADFPPTGNKRLDFLTKKVNALLRSVNSRIVRSFTLVSRTVGVAGEGVILEYQASASVSCSLYVGFKIGEIHIRVDVAGDVRFVGPFVGLKFGQIRMALEIIFGSVK